MWREGKRAGEKNVVSCKLTLKLTPAAYAHFLLVQLHELTEMTSQPQERLLKYVVFI